MTASFAAAISKPCGCSHERHMIGDGIYCGGPRREAEGIVYCLSCWAATFHPGLAIANDRSGTVRVLDFSLLDKLFRAGHVTAQQAWEACPLPGREWEAYAAALEENAEPPRGVDWGPRDVAGFRLGWATREDGLRVQWEQDENGWSTPTGVTDPSEEEEVRT